MNAKPVVYDSFFVAANTKTSRKRANKNCLISVINSTQKNCKSIYIWENLVVYSLHGQTGWFTGCTNVMQNSGLVNFVPESRLPFEKSIPLIGKRARKSEKYWYQTWLWRNMEREFPSGTFHQEKQDCLFRRFLAPGNFPLKRPEKSSVPFTFKRNFSETFCKWLTTHGHQSISYSPYFPQFWSEINGSFRNWPLDRYVVQIVAHYGAHWWRSVNIVPPFVSIK